MPGSPKLSLSFIFTYQNPVYTSPVPHMRYAHPFFLIISPEQYWVRVSDH
jgi:hypothetical protein